jgi:tetratricopeptide (TPR) repeat protein
MKKAILPLLPILLAAIAPALAQQSRTQYDMCLARVQTDPQAALLLATGWAKQDGGGPADHCTALALVSLHRYPEAAAKLDALAHSSFASDNALRSELSDQAGNSWLLAGQPDNAVASFTTALRGDPANSDLLTDRARAYALQQNWAKAESDLGAALMVEPDRVDLLILRGSARHAMGHKADARADFDRALQLRPGNSDALVERGVMKLEAGDNAGARSDWQAAVASGPGSAAGERARQYLANGG